MSEHVLKIHPKPFRDLESGVKTGEVRNCADRDFKVGDGVRLVMIDETGNPTGNEMHRQITHIQTGYGLPDDICVLSYGRPLLHPIQQTLRDNGDLIAAQATIAQQAQMIEHLRGGPTPLYTTVDMTTASADGFKDGAASHWQSMETCPKHKDVLFYREDAGVFTGQFTYCETFMSEKEVEESDYDEQTLYAEDAFSFGPDGAYRCDGDLVPTHWMPFPPEPEVQP